MIKGHVCNCILLSLMVCLVLSGCTPKVSLPKDSSSNSSESNSTPRDATPTVLVPTVGEVVYTCDYATIDASNVCEGYIMVTYTGTNAKVKLQITSPLGVNYTYLLSGNHINEAFPLTEGNGVYQLTIYENVSSDQYAAILAQDIELQLADEFKPFLYPNQYVNFTAESKTVEKASSLAKDAHSDLEVVTAVYDYAINNITYDTELAEHVAYGYLPVVDRTLSTQTGICFDYAALMTAMLRSQRIPTKLEVGYSGEAYHAWISTYIDDIGWVDNVIQFDGSSWSLMDPTLAANNSDKKVKKYVGNGDNYLVKYTY